MTIIAIFSGQGTWNDLRGTEITSLNFTGYAENNLNGMKIAKTYSALFGNKNSTEKEKRT